MISVALGASATGGAVAQLSERTEVSKDSYDVYSALLTQHYGSWFKWQQVLISASTVLESQGHPGSVAGCRQQVAQRTVVRDLFAKLVSEKQQFWIAAKLQVPGQYKMFESKRATLENGESSVFFLSPVEFSDDGSRAVVFAARDCGALCGEGHLWILDKHSNHWQLVSEQANCGWIR